MIAKARSISHGSAMTNYATKHNRADIVLTRNLGEGAYSSLHVGSDGNYPPEV